MILHGTCNGHIGAGAAHPFSFLSSTFNYYVIIDPFSSCGSYISYPVPLKVGVRGFSGLALIKWQVKLKVKVNITLEQATKAQRGSTL